MNYITSLPSLLIIGTLGGLLGLKTKFPGGVIIGAMLSIILFKLLSRMDWSLPRYYSFILQVLLGIMVGSSFQLEMIGVIKTILLPVVTSTLALVLTGLIISMIFARLNILDMGTAYLGTSPGAMSALLVLALDSGKNPTVIMCFHFFRVVFIILTLPIIYKLFFR
jgi:membrane AbrB-like protein